MRKHEFTNIKEKYRDFSPTKSDAMSAQAKAAHLKTEGLQKAGSQRGSRD